MLETCQVPQVLAVGPQYLTHKEETIFVGRATSTQISLSLRTPTSLIGRVLCSGLDSSSSTSSTTRILDFRTIGVLTRLQRTAGSFTCNSHQLESWEPALEAIFLQG